MALKKIDYFNIGKADSLEGRELPLVKISQQWQRDAYTSGWQEGEDEKAEAKAAEYQKAVDWKPPRMVEAKVPRRVRDMHKRIAATVATMARRAQFRKTTGLWA